MISYPFPSISPARDFFENPDPLRAAEQERLREEALAERLRIAAFDDTENPPRPEVPPRPSRKREARESRFNPETILPPTPQSSTIIASSQCRNLLTSEAEAAALRIEISGIKDKVQGLKNWLEIKNRDFDGLNERLKRTERKYEEAIIDMRRSREEKQELEDMVGRLRRELNETRDARNIAEALLATKQRELVDAMETLRLSGERRARENERMAEVQDEATRRATEERVEEARREGRREGRRERKRPNVTLVVEERPQSSVSWTLFMGRRAKT